MTNTPKRIDWEKVKEIIIANSKRDENSIQTKKVKVYTVRFMSLVCLVLTIMNIVNHYTIMTVATGLMSVGFLVCSFLYGKRGMIKLGNNLCAVMVALIFTFFAIGGRNEGFAILWILLVPAVASNILNLRLGLILCGYFQILLVMMFYTPLRENFTSFYTETFIFRYPVLYMASFIVSYIIVLEKEYYSIQIDKMAHTDALTGIANRREYEDVLTRIELDWDNYENIRCFSMDLNGLKKANDNIGHHAGDELLAGAAECIANAFDNALVVARIGGDEFAVVTDRPESEIDVQMAHLSDNVRMWRGQYVQRISISSGSASKAEFPGMDINELANQADKEMYEEKRRYYQSAGIDRRNRRNTLVNFNINKIDE